MTHSTRFRSNPENSPSGIASDHVTFVVRDDLGDLMSHSSPNDVVRSDAMLDRHAIKQTGVRGLHGASPCRRPSGLHSMHTFGVLMPAAPDKTPLALTQPWNFHAKADRSGQCDIRMGIGKPDCSTERVALPNRNSRSRE